MANTTITSFAVKHGDSFLIKTFDALQNPYNILVDSGPKNSFKQFGNQLSKALEDIDTIHLMVISHVDDDHIGGLLKIINSHFLNNITIKEIWFNYLDIAPKVNISKQISLQQGIDLRDILLNKSNFQNIESEVTTDFKPITPEGIDIKILSPNTESHANFLNNWSEYEKIVNPPVDLNASGYKSSSDKYVKLRDLEYMKFVEKKDSSNIFNESCIAFWLKTPDKSILMLGDASNFVIMDSLEKVSQVADSKLEFDLVKVSHHGSRFNTNCDLLDLITCEKYLISTNGGYLRSKHPDRIVLARLLHNPNRNKNIRREVFFNHHKEDLEKRVGVLVTSEELQECNGSFHFNSREICL